MRRYISYRTLFGLAVLAIMANTGCEDSRQLDCKPPAPPDVSNEMILGGISRPNVVAADEAKVDPEADVVGISVGNEHRAYLVSAFDASGIQLIPSQMVRLRKHIVNDVVNGRPVTVTYCDRSKCLRVFSDSNAKASLNVGLAGFRDGKMLLHYGGKTYVHNDKSFPIAEMKFVVVKWKEWKRLHSETKVYLGTPGY